MLKLKRCATLATLALALGLYGMSASNGNAQGAVCQAAKALAPVLDPLAKGEVAAMQVPKDPKALPDLAFRAPDGQPMKLSDRRGKVVLLNLWATWCAPCRHEMPALDRLQQALGGADFEVVAVNIDQRNLDRPRTFLSEIQVEKLAFYHDPSARIFTALKAVDRAFGMPTTLLIDKEGCELGYLAGPAEWSSDDAQKLIRAAIAR